MMKHTRRGFRPIVLLAALIFSVISIFAQPGFCTTLRAMSLERLVASSDTVVLGRAETTQTTRGANGRIVTLVTYEVEQYVVGNGPAHLTVQLLGGTLNGITQYVQGEAQLPTGETTLLFLESKPKTGEAHFVVTGLSQGVFKIVEHEGTPGRFAVRDQGSLNLVDAPSADKIGLARSDTSTYLSLEKLLDLVRELVGENP